MMRRAWLRGVLGLALGLVALSPAHLQAHGPALSEPPLAGTVAGAEASRAPGRPSVLQSRGKPGAPMDLELVVLSGGASGERARLLLWAEPGGSGGRLDLGIRLPEGLRVVSGATSDSTPSAGGSRLVEVEVEVPASGFHRVLGTARWTLPGGQVWTRAVTLDLPAGGPPPGKPELPVRALPGGGFRVELQGSVP